MSKGNHEHERFVRIVELFHWDNGEKTSDGEELQWVCLQCGEVYYKVNLT